MERTTLTSGIRWMRYLLIPIIFVCFTGIFGDAEEKLPFLICLCICIGLYYLLVRSRRMSFDSQHLYIIHGKAEQAVHYSDIISIKKSSTKVNGRRYWKVLYKDGARKERTRRYFPPMFDRTNRNFYEAVQKINPDVVVWTHPFFNH